MITASLHEALRSTGCTSPLLSRWSSVSDACQSKLLYLDEKLFPLSVSNKAKPKIESVTIECYILNTFVMIHVRIHRFIHTPMPCENMSPCLLNRPGEENNKAGLGVYIIITKLDWTYQCWTGRRVVQCLIYFAQYNT